MSEFKPAEPVTTPRSAKRHAAVAALSLIRSGMRVGLGTGSTAVHFIEALAASLRAGVLHDIVGIPTSVGSELLARRSGIPLADFSTVESCDITVDGADEIDHQLNVIKGLGGALLREKVVAQNSRRLVIIADAAKRVTRLGTRGPLPVEVIGFGNEAHERFLRSLGCEPTIRRSTGGMVFVTDNGNHILDCHFPDGIVDVNLLNQALCERAGIVEHGLFIGLSTDVILSDEAGRISTMRR